MMNYGGGNMDFSSPPTGTMPDGSSPNGGFNWGQMGPAMGGVAGGALSLLGMGQDPSKAYQKGMQPAFGDINQWYDQANNMLSPYDKAGQNAMGQYQGMLSQMSDPQGFYDKMMSGFQMTPAQKYAQQQGLNAVGSNAAMSGMMGSGNEAKALESYAQNTTQDAQQQYLQNVLGINNQALGGYGNLTNMGFNAAGQMGNWDVSRAQDLANMQQAIAAMKAKQAQSNNNGWATAAGDIGGAIAHILL